MTLTTKVEKRILAHKTWISCQIVTKKLVGVLEVEYERVVKESIYQSCSTAARNGSVMPYIIFIRGTKSFYPRMKLLSQE